MSDWGLMQAVSQYNKSMAQPSQTTTSPWQQAPKLPAPSGPGQTYHPDNSMLPAWAMDHASGGSNWMQHPQLPAPSGPGQMHTPGTGFLGGMGGGQEMIWRPGMGGPGDQPGALDPYVNRLRGQLPYGNDNQMFPMPSQPAPQPPAQLPEWAMAQPPVDPRTQYGQMQPPVSPVQSGLGPSYSPANRAPGSLDASAPNPLDQNMDGIDDRIFQAQQKQTQLDAQMKMKQLESKREVDQLTQTRKMMEQRRKQQEQLMKQQMQAQPIGQFGNSWNSFQDMRRKFMGQNAITMNSPLAGDGSFARSYGTPEGSLPRDTAPLLMR